MVPRTETTSFNSDLKLVDTIERKNSEKKRKEFYILDITCFSVNPLSAPNDDVGLNTRVTRLARASLDKRRIIYQEESVGDGLLPSRVFPFL